MRPTSRLALAALTGALAIAVAAPAQAVPTQTIRTTSVVTAAQGGDLCAQDRQFLRGAHRGNLAEIAGGYVALARSSRRDVRDIARMLIQDHRSLDRDVRATARRYDVDLPATPNARQLKELVVVAGRPARTFDRAWLRLQETSHLRTLGLIDTELQQGCAREVRMLARAARPVVREHLQMVRAALRRTT